MDNVWILVADRSGASFFKRNRPSKGIRLFREVEHPEGRLKAGEINSDRPGRIFNFAQRTKKSGYSSPVTPEEHLSIDFAKELAHFLDTAKMQNEYRYLVVVAGPTFLGHLRSSLKHVDDALIGEVSKNLGRINARDLTGHVRDVLLEIDSNPRLERAA